MVGDKPCTAVVHDAVTPNSKLVCAAPVSYGLAKPVMLLQSNGQLSTNVGTMNYALCPAGTFPNASLTSDAVRARWPRGHYSCPCGSHGIVYASFEHYTAGDW